MKFAPPRPSPIATTILSLLATAAVGGEPDAPKHRDPPAHAAKIQCVKEPLDKDRWRLVCEDRSKGLAVLCDDSLEYRCACIHGDQYRWTYGHVCVDAGVSCFAAPCAAEAAEEPGSGGP